MKTNTHLNLEQRNTIQLLLGYNKTFTEIGNSIGKDRTTISKEIKNNRYSKYGYSNTNTSYCPKLDKKPYICNFCTSKGGCKKNVLYYNAKIADEKYNLTLKVSRRGVNVSPYVVDEIEQSIVPLIKHKKQSINQVYANHSDVLYFSKTTFYKYVNDGILSLTNLDLPKKVKYKERKNKNEQKERRKLAILKGRSYEDFLLFKTNHPSMNIIEMDTVIGTIDSKKVLLTLLIRKTNFMLIFLIDNKTKSSVNKVFDFLKEQLGIKLYSNIFRIVLTDNGCEFFDPKHIEYDYTTGKKKCNLFYCEPYSSWQKGSIEKNHEYIRKVFTKGTEFDNMTQKQIKRLENNINNVPRVKLNNQTPYELTKKIYPELIEKLNCLYISPDNVTLNQKEIKGDK